MQWYNNTPTLQLVFLQISLMCSLNVSLLSMVTTPRILRLSDDLTSCPSNSIVNAYPGVFSKDCGSMVRIWYFWGLAYSRFSLYHCDTAFVCLLRVWAAFCISLSLVYIWWSSAYINGLADCLCSARDHFGTCSRVDARKRSLADTPFFVLATRCALLKKGSQKMALHTAGAREIWIDQSGFSRWEKIYCPHINVSWQERHWNQATFLIGDCIKYSLKGIYNSKNHFTVQKVKNMKHLVSPSF